MEIGRKYEYTDRKTVRSKEIALCVIGRKENRYAREFVKHYKDIGFDHIIICDNNRDGEEFFEDVLRDYIEEGFVEVMNFRNKPGMQCIAYSAVYRKYADKYAWIAFFDFDEYLTITRGFDIHTLMDSYTSQECVFFNWMNYGDNGLLRYDGRPLQERFTTPLPEQYVQYEDIPENDHVKCMVRGGVQHLSFYLCPHLPRSPQLKCCTASGVRCEQKPFQKADFSVAYLKHYITKTTEEWFGAKWFKGAGTNDSIEQYRSRYAGRFFKYNQWTEEKDTLMRELIGLPPFVAPLRKNVVIVHYNTQSLTDAAIRSLNKYTPGCSITVFDNSDKEPFINTYDNVTVIDNTKGQYEDMDAFIARYPDKVEEIHGSNFGSAKHCRSVDICTDLIPEGFLLMDSDVIVKRDVTPFFDASVVWTGSPDASPSRWGIVCPRVLPFICYLNVPMMRKHGIRYFDDKRMYALTHEEPYKAYDTGASFYDDCNQKGLVGHHIMITDYIIHFNHGSWLGQSPDEWLESNRRYWE